MYLCVSFANLCVIVATQSHTEKTVRRLKGKNLTHRPQQKPAPSAGQVISGVKELLAIGPTLVIVAMLEHALGQTGFRADIIE